MATNLTKQYPFDSLSVGSSFTVYQRFQHCRVAASEYARRHNLVFTCRMAHDNGTDSMTVYRVEVSQRPVDQRGRNARRRIPSQSDPTALQFDTWLASLLPGQSYLMPATYAHCFNAMQAWCELHSLKRHRNVTSVLQEGCLLIKIA